MSEKLVYIENLRKYPSTFTVMKTVSVDGDNGKKVDVERPAGEVTVEKRMVDPSTGAVITSGFTAMTQTTYDALIAQSHVFAEFIKTGEYVLFDELPIEAQSPSDLIARTSNELAVANARIAELEDALKKGKNGSALVELQKKNEELSAQVNSLTDANAVATAKIAELSGELETLKNGGTL